MGVRVGVVVPVHNGQRFIEAALLSVLDQAGEAEFDVVCVDDGSQDDSISRINAFEGSFFSLRVIRNPRSLGQGAARNRGFAALDTEIVTFLDQDDRWHPNKTSLQLGLLSAHSDYEFCVGWQSFALESPHETPHWFRPEWNDAPQVGFLPSALMVRRSFFVDSGGFDEEYRWGGDDLDWFARAIRGRVPYGVLEEVLVTRSIHEANHSRYSHQSNRELLTIIRRHLGGDSR